MNLACPTCQKLLTVPAENAGQQMKCPLCGKIFQVPVLPDVSITPPASGDLPADISLSPLPPLPEDSPVSALGHELPADKSLTSLPPSQESKPSSTPIGTEESTYPMVPEPRKPPSSPPPRRRESAAPVISQKSSTTEKTSTQAAPPLPPAGYTKSYVFQLRPKILPWITAVALGLLFILWFFSWVSASPGGYGVYTQTAWEALFVSCSKDPVGEKVLKEDENVRQNMSGSWLMLLYFPATLIAIAFAVASLVFGKDRSRLLPALQQVWPWRVAITGAAATFAFLVLLFQSWSGFGLENSLKRIVDANPKLADEVKKDTNIKLLESRPEFETMMNTLVNLGR